MDAQQIARDFFAENPVHRSTKFEIYSTSYSQDQIGSIFSQMSLGPSRIKDFHPALFVAGTFSDLEVKVFHGFQLAAIADGTKRIMPYLSIHTSRPPTFDGVLFASPIIHDGTRSTHHGSAREAIGVLKSLLVGLLGRGFLLDLAASFEVAGDHDSGMRFSSDGRMFRQEDAFAIMNSDAYAELLHRISLQIEPLRSQLILACQFVSAAITEEHDYKRFFDYWTALEVAAQGTSLAIRRLLATAYQETMTFVDLSLGFKSIAAQRHALIHKGKLDYLPPEMERRLQTLFLDVLAHRVGLPSRKLTAELTFDS